MPESLRAISEQFQSSFRTFFNSFHSFKCRKSLRAIAEQFQGNFRAISEQFWNIFHFVSFIQIPEECRDNFRAVSEQSQGSFRAGSGQFILLFKKELHWNVSNSVPLNSSAVSEQIQSVKLNFGAERFPSNFSAVPEHPPFRFIHSNAVRGDFRAILERFQCKSRTVVRALQFNFINLKRCNCSRAILTQLKIIGRHDDVTNQPAQLFNHQ